MRVAWNHEPQDYDCPFCRIQQGQENDLQRAPYADRLAAALGMPRTFEPARDPSAGRRG